MQGSKASLGPQALSQLALPVPSGALHDLLMTYPHDQITRLHSQNKILLYVSALLDLQQGKLHSQTSIILYVSTFYLLH